MTSRTIDTMYVTEVRSQCLDRAIREVGPGTPWERCFNLANQYATYILEGTWATPVADAEKAAEEADKTEHDFEPTPGKRGVCQKCHKLLGEGNHL